MDEALVREIVAQVAGRMAAQGTPLPAGEPCGVQCSNAAGTAERVIPVEVSARHVHLSPADVEALFGKGHELTPCRDLSQTGQFLCQERVRLVGPKGVLDGVAILGPARKATQAELSATDARKLGLKAPARMSGNLSGAADVLITVGNACVQAKGCVIVAKPHIHMRPQDAAAFGVQNGGRYNVLVNGEKPLRFENVEVRVDESFRLAMHIDTDEAGACMAGPSTSATLCGVAVAACEAPAPPVAISAQTGAKRGGVISAEEAKALCEAGTDVLLPKGSIVTPLARDVFHDHRIAYTIEK